MRRTSATYSLPLLKPEKTVGEYELSDIESESANEPDSKVPSDKGASGGPS